MITRYKTLPGDSRLVDWVFITHYQVCDDDKSVGNRIKRGAFSAGEKPSHGWAAEH